MIRGTTPTHTFKLPFSTSLIEKVYIVYTQEVAFGKTIRLEKGKDDSEGVDSCEFDGNNVIVKLTQEETLSFVHGINVKIQLIVKTVDQKKPVSKIFEVEVGKILKEEIL